MKNLISTLILGAGLVLSSCGNKELKDPSHYKYIGKIGQDSVLFTRLNMYDDYSNLRVIKPDGREIEYEDDIIDDLKISEVSITKNGEREEYTADYVVIKDRLIETHYGKIVLKKAQKQFDNYLHKIDSIKKTPGYKDKYYQDNISTQTPKNHYQDSILNQALKDLD